MDKTSVSLDAKKEALVNLSKVLIKISESGIYSETTCNGQGEIMNVSVQKCIVVFGLKC